MIWKVEYAKEKDVWRINESLELSLQKGDNKVTFNEKDLTQNEVRDIVDEFIVFVDMVEKKFINYKIETI